MAGEHRTVTFGGKAAALSPESVFSFAFGLSSTQIDSSALNKLSTSTHASTPESPLKTLDLKPELSRAAIAVFVNKLLLSDPSKIRSSILQSIVDANNRGAVFQIAADFSAIKAMDSENSEELIVLTEEESRLGEFSTAPAVGIAALVEHSVSVLGVVADAVAALSCEACGVNADVFDLPIPEDGSGSRETIDAAREIKKMLQGSKLVGASNPGKDSVHFAWIPNVHGQLRKSLKTVRFEVRNELNSAERKFLRCQIDAGSLVSNMVPLVDAIKKLAMNSMERMKSCVEAISSDSSIMLLNGAYDSFDSLVSLKKVEVRDWYSKTREDEADENYVMQCTYNLVVLVREILAWEACIALFVLRSIEIASSSEGFEESKPSLLGSEDGEGQEEMKKKGKVEKKKKKKGSSGFALGKGTLIIRDNLNTGVLKQSGNKKPIDGGNGCYEELFHYFNPINSELGELLEAVKGIAESNEMRRLPKVAKGMRDFGGEQMSVREKTFGIVKSTFTKHGGVELDTPVMELREILTGKYGEDSKLIYDLADQGGEKCSLRYDLTVPFARYFAMNGIASIKKYQIAKVYRRDNPSKGRYREFYQCDFDIAGKYPPEDADYEVVKILTELLDTLKIGDYEIKLNHRKLLDGMLEVCDVPPKKFRTVCSSIDKLDKLSWEKVQTELVQEKGLDIKQTTVLHSFLVKRGPPLQILADLKQDERLKKCGSVLDDLEVLFTTLGKFRCLDRVVFDLSLARGLDYYTGIIFEAVFKGSTQVGSIAAGGRYDNLIGMFTGKPEPVPAVGMSLGIERVFTIMEQLEKEKGIRTTKTQVLVVATAEKLKDLDPAVCEIMDDLWKSDVNAELIRVDNVKKIGKEIGNASNGGIPWVLVIGENELMDGTTKLKEMETGKQEVIPLTEVVAVLRNRLRDCQYLSTCSSAAKDIA